MTDHDPLAEALEDCDHAAWQVQVDRSYESDAATIRAALDAAP